MRSLFSFVILVALASPLAGQSNPFKARKGVESALISYTLSGSLTGTEELALNAEQSARRVSSSMKMLGKTVTSETLALTTRDSVYNIDLTQKTGFAMPNYAPLLASEYDKLSGKQKKQLQQNLELAAQTLGQAFGMGNIAQANQVAGQETVAGQACEVRTFGDWTVCTLASDPGIALRTSGKIMCMETNQVATSVALNQGVPSERFAVPSGITWAPQDTAKAPEPQETARQMLQMLSSEEFRDSLLAARDEMQAAQDSAGVQEMTPEEREQACQQLRQAFNVDLGAAFSRAMSNMAQSAAESAARNALEGASRSLRRKIKFP